MLGKREFDAAGFFYLTLNFRAIFPSSVPTKLLYIYCICIECYNFYMVEKIQMVGCAFLPIDRKMKRILISKRSMNKKYFPGFWEVIGGNLEFGEDFEDSVIREVSEEINCKIKNLEHLHSRVMYLDGLMYITVAYYGELFSEPIFNKEEISEIKWITEVELEKFVFCPGDKELLKLGFEKL